MIQATNIGSVNVGGKFLNIVSLRFPAVSEVLSAIRTYWVTENPSGKTGYAAGNGGAFSFTLHDDLNNQPGAVLEVSWGRKEQPTQNLRGGFPLVYFGHTKLALGKYYHVVIQNTMLDPRNNFATLDLLENDTLLGQTPDLQVLISQEGGPFKPFPKFMGSPVGLFYADGTVQGYGYYQVGPGGTLLAAVQYGYPPSICK